MPTVICTCLIPPAGIGMCNRRILNAIQFPRECEGGWWRRLCSLLKLAWCFDSLANHPGGYMLRNHFLRPWSRVYVLLNRLNGAGWQNRVWLMSAALSVELQVALLASPSNEPPSWPLQYSFFSHSPKTSTTKTIPGILWEHLLMMHADTVYSGV